MAKCTKGLADVVVDDIDTLTYDCHPNYSAAALLLALSHAPSKVQGSFWSMIFQVIQQYQHATPDGQNNLTIDACKSLSRVIENCPEIFC